jgi:uncharacterized protein YjbI with pentapeptide repeats
LTVPVAPDAPDLPTDVPTAEIPEGPLHDLRLLEVVLAGADLSGRAASGLTLRDVEIRDGDWSTLRADRGSLTRVDATGLRATGVELGESRLRDVCLVECRLDLSSFRHATFERVVFRNCRLDEADFYGATMTSVLFVHTTLVGASFEAALFDRCELRSCELDGLRGVERMRGVRMPWPDVVQIAGLLAAAAGIEIVE